MVLFRADFASGLLITLTTVFGITTYFWGVFFSPIISVTISALAIIGGTFLFVPEGSRVFAGTSGLVAVLIAGIIILRYSGTILTTLLSGIVLFVTFSFLQLDKSPKNIGIGV